VKSGAILVTPPQGGTDLRHAGAAFPSLRIGMRAATSMSFRMP